MHVTTDDLFTMRKDPDDKIELGDIVGYAIDPDIRWARVMGILKNVEILPSSMRVILREFQPGDEEWPTGKYTQSPFVVPWTGEHKSWPTFS